MSGEATKPVNTDNTASSRTPGALPEWMEAGESAQPNGAEPTTMNTKRMLYRHPTDKVIGGVCGGIAEYFGIDPTVVRLIWALFSLMGGCGILAYIIAAIIIPRNPVC